MTTNPRSEDAGAAPEVDPDITMTESEPDSVKVEVSEDMTPEGKDETLNDKEADHPDKMSVRPRLPSRSNTVSW
jgi:hypothetical protein